MEINVSIPGEDNQELIQSMYEWFIYDDEIRTGARIKLVNSRPEPGSMTGGIELISLLVSSGFNIASLAVAIASWRSSRTPSPIVHVEVLGNIATIDESDHETVVIEKVEGVLLAGQEDADA